MAKRFRKVYLVLSDNDVFSQYKYESTEIYRRKEEAERICKLRNIHSKTVPGKWHEANKPAPVYKVHGFYLIHEDWFKEDEKPNE